LTTSFAPFAEQFLQYAHEIVWCTVTTIDAKGRPRSRILHPIWQIIDDRPVGWIVTGQTPVKARHLAANPHLACSYWSPEQHTVMIDCVASWVEDADLKRHIFDLFMTTPPPLGYDLRGFGAEGPESPTFTPLRLDAWRVQITPFEGWFGSRKSRIWRAEELK
jgi:uncharacterized pyridoxamine 5'-phosphate oxidase family protein